MYLVNKTMVVDLWCGINRTPEKQGIFWAKHCTTGRDTDAFYRKKQIRTLEPNLTWWTSGFPCCTLHAESPPSREISKLHWCCHIKHRKISIWEPGWQELPMVRLHTLIWTERFCVCALSNWGSLSHTHADLVFTLIPWRKWLVLTWSMKHALWRN